MGFDLDAYLGRESDLRGWRSTLPSAVVCPLHGDLAMVPATSALMSELRARLGLEECARLDAAQRHPGWPSPSFKATVSHWGSIASRGTTVAYISIGEFGNQSHEEATLWSNGGEVASEVGLGAVLKELRARAGVRFDEAKLDLERYRGEGAGEKWAAAALRDDARRG